MPSVMRSPLLEVAMRQSKLVITCTSLMLALGLPSLAQDNRSDHYPPQRIIVDRFDSFENTSVEFEEAALDTFAVALQNAPDQIGYIIVYAGRRACSGEAQTRGMRMKKYLVEYRGIEWDRVIWKDGGHLEKPYVLLEMQVRGAEPYPYTYPEALPIKDVKIVNCKAKDKGNKRRGKSKAAPNNGMQRTANERVFYL